MHVELADAKALTAYLTGRLAGGGGCAAVQVAAISAHAELAAPVALCGCLLLVHALGLPLPDVGGAWAAARRAVVRRAERAPLHRGAGAPR